MSRYLQVGVGVLLFLATGEALYNFDLFYSERGFLPIHLLVSSGLVPDGLCLHLLSRWSGFHLVLFLLQAVLAGAVAADFQSREAALGASLLWLSQLLRNPLIVEPGDLWLALLLGWGGGTDFGRANDGWWGLLLASAVLGVGTEGALTVSGVAVLLVLWFHPPRQAVAPVDWVLPLASLLALGLMVTAPGPAVSVQLELANGSVLDLDLRARPLASRPRPARHQLYLEALSTPALQRELCRKLGFFAHQRDWPSEPLEVSVVASGGRVLTRVEVEPPPPPVWERLPAYWLEEKPDDPRNTWSSKPPQARDAQWDWSSESPTRNDDGREG